jgi:hypothetical protein
VISVLERECHFQGEEEELLLVNSLQQAQGLSAPLRRTRWGMDKPKKSKSTKRYKMGITMLSKPFVERELHWR